MLHIFQILYPKSVLVNQGGRFILKGFTDGVHPDMGKQIVELFKIRSILFER